MTAPPPQVPYGAPPPAGDNPYATGNPYHPAPAAVPPPQPGPPGYGPAGPTAPPPGQPEGYAQPAAYGQPGPYGQPAPGGAVCRFCGGFPAVEATVRGHQGLIVVMRFLKQPGPFCRTCGTAVLRDMSARTLVQGWWGYASSIATPITLLMNLAVHGKLRRLPPPVPGAHGPQPDPGPPLTRRPHLLMLLLPVAAITTLIVTAATGTATDDRGGGTRPVAVPTLGEMPTFPAPTFSMPSFSMPSFSIPPVPEFTATPKATPSPSRVPSDVERAKAGDCLRNENQTGPTATKDPSPRITMLDCGDARAQYKVVAKVLGTADGQSACEKYPTAESWFRRDGGSPATSFVLCLAPVSTKAPAS